MSGQTTLHKRGFVLLCFAYLLLLLLPLVAYYLSAAFHVRGPHTHARTHEQKRCVFRCRPSPSPFLRHTITRQNRDPAENGITAYSNEHAHTDARAHTRTLSCLCPSMNFFLPCSLAERKRTNIIHSLKLKSPGIFEAWRASVALIGSHCGD